ncbi:DUF6668 family protein [Kribbella sp. NBC_00889]|uniref:DUF6668 family protein n=1 Tax=Kribbella sp. NBC_00889 TaxID=2975974 RepID=UPI00386FBC92|nr:hypothetical protein OG817_13170 [Kribbella sp. NBC_00889]
MVSTGPAQPHPGLQAQLSGLAVSASSPAQAHPEPSAPGVWIVGVHGGAGESTISELSALFREAHHRWPQPPPYGSVLCLMAARTNAAGLHNARAAAREWAAGAQPHVVLLGLVLIPDAPGRLPRELARQVTLTSGGVPRVWQLPWVDAWRLHAPGYTALDTTDLPRPVKKLLVDLDELTSLNISKENPSL